SNVDLLKWRHPYKFGHGQQRLIMSGLCHGPQFTKQDGLSGSFRRRCLPLSVAKHVFAGYPAVGV
ncbi:hypothetical protein, partial [Acidithiobacillus caldus]|uniref:hypothetical protein n=1 Tax=Acidithiobacillus caldus TaxID=33059 RepID=UPI001A7E1ABB